MSKFDQEQAEGSREIVDRELARDQKPDDAQPSGSAATIDEEGDGDAPKGPGDLGAQRRPI